MGLTGLQWNVLSTMICNIDHNNVIKLKQKHIADELKIAPTRVSEAVKVFKEKGILIEDTDPNCGKIYIFNPQFGHMGSDIKKTNKKFKHLKEYQGLNPHAKTLSQKSTKMFKIN